MSNQMPNITACPQDPNEAARWIYDWQDKLNELALGINLGTVAIGLGENDELIADISKKYLRAYLSECSENQENFFWKHWSKEAKNGLYFHLVAHEAILDKAKKEELVKLVERISGKSLIPDEVHALKVFLETPARTPAESLQNVKVELVDMVFFLLSIAQTIGINDYVWANEWTHPTAWNFKAELTESERHSMCVDYTISAFGYLNNAVKFREEKLNHIVSAIEELKNACALFFTMAEINAGYAEKLKINYERQIRGRLQIGDTLSETENKRV